MKPMCKDKKYSEYKFSQAHHQHMNRFQISGLMMAHIFIVLAVSSEDEGG
jgi:hypothetical protein